MVTSRVQHNGMSGGGGANLTSVSGKSSFSDRIGVGIGGTGRVLFPPPTPLRPRPTLRSLFRPPDPRANRRLSSCIGSDGARFHFRSSPGCGYVMKSAKRMALKIRIPIPLLSKKREARIERNEGTNEKRVQPTCRRSVRGQANTGSGNRSFLPFVPDK